MDEAPSETLDAFHRGRFYVLQPKGRGHRAGLDAMLLAALVPDDATGRLADFGAGAGAAGLAVASRVPGLDVVLIENAVDMARFARRSVALPQNQALAARVAVLEADVTLSGARRVEAGLADDCFDHVIMNPPFNDGGDRVTPDALKQHAHAMRGPVFENWIRTAGAVTRPGGQLSLIARPESLTAILAACGNRFGGVQMTPIYPRPGRDAFRLLVTGVKGSRARPSLRPPLHVHEEGEQAFSPFVDALNNGRACLSR